MISGVTLNLVEYVVCSSRAEQICLVTETSTPVNGELLHVRHPISTETIHRKYQCEYPNCGQKFRQGNQLAIHNNTQYVTISFLSTAILNSYL